MTTKKTLLLAVASTLVVSTAISGCGAKRASYLSNTANLDPEAQKIWTRPVETSIKIGMTDTEGSASQTMLLGFTLKGDSPAQKFSFLFLRMGDNYDVAGSLQDLGQLDNIAISRAISAATADGLYITKIESDSKGLWPFYVERDVTVTGKPISLVDLGMVEQERYDRRALYEIIFGSGSGDGMMDLLEGEGSILSKIGF